MAKILPGAKVIGDVKIGKKSSVWYNAVIRGDLAPIKIGSYSNIQDNCVIHVTDKHGVKIGDYVSVGHGAILHGCKIKDNVLIGMNATVLNAAVINENSIVGAGAVVTQNKEFPPGSLILGVPAKVVRELTKKEIKSIKENAIKYYELACKQEK